MNLDCLPLNTGIPSLFRSHSPELDNLVPQAKNVNPKQYREIEREWKKALKKVPPDNITDLKIEIIYDGNNVRPNAFNIKYKKNGRVIKIPTIYN